MKGDSYYRRSIVFKIALGALFLIFIFRLVQLQLLDSSMKDRANRNALLLQSIYPSRGLIFDRNGEILVFNQPFYDLMVITKSISTDFDTLAFCSLIDITKRECDSIFKRIKDKRINRGFSPYTPQIFINNLRQEDVVAIQENMHRFDGIFLQKKYNRGYTYGQSYSHLLGSIGEVSQEEIDADKYYCRGDLIGKDGIEKFYESTLRGQKGVNVLLRDSKGRIQGRYQDGSLDEPVISGIDLTLTIDIHLQRMAETLLSNKIGSVVAIEPQTGDILAMVSAPSFNLEELTTKSRGRYYNFLLQNPQKPLINRATQAIYSPGSTFKIIQALACLQEGTLTPNTIYTCNGTNSSPIKCTHSHGNSINLLNAIEQSCNPYFWNAFRDFLQKDGYGDDNQNFKDQYERWREIVMSFGLGQFFDKSDILNPSIGNVPTSSWYDKIYGPTGWRALTIRSLSIGQGEVLITPLQLANVAAIIANKGYFIPPHLNKNGNFYRFIQHTKVDSSHFNIVQEGMRHVMKNGTGRYYDVPSLDFCGKTGTVQNNQGKDHAVFIGFAPLHNPKIAIAVAVENAGFGATWAAPIASLLMEFYLTGSNNNKNLFKRIAETNLIQNE